MVTASDCRPFKIDSTISGASSVGRRITQHATDLVDHGTLDLNG
jgi:hypothetical protein